VLLALKSIWALVLTAVAGLLLVMRAMEVTEPLQALFRVELQEDPHDFLASFLIGLLPSMSLGAELVLGLIALAAAVLTAVQVWTLWRKQPLEFRQPGSN
jgi:uncharacterized membrane protein